MQTLILIGSIIGIVNSFILIIYALVSKKGNRKANAIFALFIFALTLRISKSILLDFFNGLTDLFITLGVLGFMAIGPTYLYFAKAIINSKFKFHWKQLSHILPAIVFTLIWIYFDPLRGNGGVLRVFYRAILLQYIIYLSFAIYYSTLNLIDKPHIKNQLNIINVFLLAIWFTNFLNEVAGFPSISEAILYVLLIYFSIITILNKGYIINLSSSKYKNTGLDFEENQRILKGLEVLLEKDMIFKKNTLSLVKLTKLLNTNTHVLSQVINENKEQTFFELIGSYRIKESKRLLCDSPELKISDIAYEIGYNSLSAFNTAFKKSTGLTPTKYRNDKVDS
jgi:AraC-like DNA-binding protein